MKKNIAILGGSGFIGTRLCDRLNKREDLDFIILDIYKSEKYPKRWRFADVRDCASLVENLDNVDVVINLAAEHRDDISPTSRYFETNVTGQENLCKAMDECSIKTLIFASSVAVYGFVTEDTDEEGKISPFHAYGESKYKAELVAQNWLSEDKKLFVVRPTVVFGEGNRGNVYNLLRQIALGRFLMIGPGKNKKSMAYVENVAAFIEYLVDRENKLQIFNYVDKPDFDMNTLISLVNKVLGRSPSNFRLPYVFGLSVGYFFDVMSILVRRKFPISSLRIKKFCAQTQFRSNTDYLGFEKPVTLEEGLTRTIKNEF